MSDKLFNAELRDCARVNEAVSIEEQHRIAMEAADLILFVVDAVDGLTPVDQEISSYLRKLN